MREKKVLEILITAPLVIARKSEGTVDAVRMSFVIDNRRSNLLSLMNWREFFKAWDYKTILLHTQCDEIASGMQQCLAELAFTTALTKPRNDELFFNGVHSR
jgi:hypothetical protein